VPQLLLHPVAPSAAIERVTAEVRWQSGRLGFHFVLEGDVDRLQLPAPRQRERGDELWLHTCCEAFVADQQGGGYSEFNFSPSGAWAAYHFSGYRAGMRPVAVVADPLIELRRLPGRIELDASLGSRSLPVGDKGLRLGLTAVVEDVAGALSWWALAHPAARPDFHRAEGFTFHLSPTAAS